jgi:hypothetical protein
VAQDVVCELSSKLQNYPIEEVLTAEHLVIDWRPDLVKEVLDIILPENIYIIIEAKKFSLVRAKIYIFITNQFAVINCKFLNCRPLQRLSLGMAQSI